MPTLTGTIDDVTGSPISALPTLRVTVRAPSRRASLAEQARLVSSVPVPVEVSPTGEISVELEPGPAVMLVEGEGLRDVYELYVTADMTLLTEAAAEAAPANERSWAESQMVQLRTETVTAAADAYEAAIATGQDRAEIELLRQNLIDAANENAAPHLTQAALSATYASSDLTVSVADPRFGAVCDWNGTTGTDNTTAIRAAIAHARSLGIGAALVYPEGAGQGYYVSETIEHGADLSVDMRAPIVHPGGAVTVRFGSSTKVSIATARLNLRAARTTPSTWDDPGDIGMELINFTRCEINILAVDDFTIGARFHGHGGGFAGNRGQIGNVGSCQIGIDYRGSTNGAAVGWCNSNHHQGGYFLNKNGRNPGKPRYGVRYSGNYQNNGNVLDGAAFELKVADAGSAEVVVALAEAGDYNHLLNIRHEQSGPVALKQVGASQGNRVEAAMSFVGVDMTIDNSLSTRDSGTVEKADRRALSRQQRIVWRAENMHRYACYYDGSVSTHVPGLMFWQSSQSNPQRVVPGVPIAANYLELPSTRAIGGYISTRQVKRFRLSADVDAGYGGRWILIAFNAAGERLTADGTIKGAEVTLVVPFASFGGAFRPGADMDFPLGIGVAADVDYIWVGIAGGTNPARLRSIEVGCGSDRPVSAWQTWIDRENVGTAAPTAGTWERGRRVLHANPAPGQPQGWVCTTAGTPGTWTAMPNL